MKHEESRVISQNTLKTVKKGKVIKLGLGVNIFFAPASWADHLSNFFVFNLFCQKVTVNLQNKNILS